MNVLVITSKRLQSYPYELRDIYYRFFNARRVPNHGLLLIEHPIFSMVKMFGRYMHEKVDLNAPYDDVDFYYVNSKPHQKLESLIKNHTVYLLGDEEFKYSQLILWQIHARYNIPLERIFLSKKENLGSFMRSSKGGLFEPHTFKPMKTFDETEIRKLIGLMVFRFVIRNYSRGNIYGPPLNSASFLFVKFFNEMNTEGLKTYEIVEMIGKEIKKFDIALYNPTLNTGVVRPKIAKRLYKSINEDIEGFSTQEFLPKIERIMDDFASQKIPYEIFFKTMIQMFIKKGDA